MRRSKSFILLSAILLCICLTVTGLAQGGILTELWNSGCDLLFHTDNVTVTGEASFSLDGQLFKTAKLHYVQDGCNSLYDLTLLTPRANGDERESGWIIIADEKGNCYVMERYYPGTYKTGFDTPNNTLLRRSVRLDAMTDLGGMLVGPLEGMLPDGALTVTEEGGTKQVRLLLTENQIPGMAVSALNMAASYLSDRWFVFGRERTLVEDACIPFENYITVTQALTDGTVRWSLREADVTFSLDAQGRMTAAQGSVRAASTFWDEVVREVTVRFDLAFENFGTSHVEPFDPDAYNVVPMYVFQSENREEPVRVLEDDEWDDMMNRSSALLSALGYSISDDSTFCGWYSGDVICVDAAFADGTECLCVFEEDGTLVGLENLTAAWDFSTEADAEDVAAPLAAEAKDRLLAFVAEYNPALAEVMGTLSVEGKMTGEDGGLYLVFEDMENYSSLYVIQAEPALRIEYFSSGAAY